MMSAIAVWNELSVEADKADHHSEISFEALKHLRNAMKCIEGRDDIAEAHIKNAMMTIELPPRSNTTPEGRPAARKLATGGLAPWQVNRISVHVREHIAQPILLGELARLVNLSTSYFSAAFKVAFGVSPHNYILQKRVEHAKEQMLRGNAPLSEIALACGLSDQAHLSRTFRRITGITPSAWRRFISREVDDEVSAMSIMDHVDDMPAFSRRVSSQSASLI
jgi:AraC family transcriptional regulator